MQYFVTELFSGSTLRNTTSVGTEQKRERVYNTMFHVPWRCELVRNLNPAHGFVLQHVAELQSLQKKVNMTCVCIAFC